MATLDLYIRELIRAFLDGQMSFERFEDAFLDETWDSRADLANVPEIVLTVERYIAELTGGYRTDEHFRSALELLAPTWVGPAVGARVESTTKPARKLVGLRPDVVVESREPPSGHSDR